MADTTVLLIDAHRAWRESAASALTHRGYRVQEASSLVDAMAYAREELALVVVDPWEADGVAFDAPRTFTRAPVVLTSNVLVGDVNRRLATMRDGFAALWEKGSVEDLVEKVVNEIGPPVVRAAADESRSAAPASDLRSVLEPASRDDLPTPAAGSELATLLRGATSATADAPVVEEEVTGEHAAVSEEVTGARRVAAPAPPAPPAPAVHRAEAPTPRASLDAPSAASAPAAPVVLPTPAPAKVAPPVADEPERMVPRLLDPAKVESRGSLSMHHLLALLGHVSRTAFSGLLTIEQEEPVGILVAQGSLVSAVTEDVLSDLPAYALRSGLIDERTATLVRQESRAAQVSDLDVLVEAGAFVGEDANEVARAHLRWLLGRVVRTPGGNYLLQEDGRVTGTPLLEAGAVVGELAMEMLDERITDAVMRGAGAGILAPLREGGRPRWSLRGTGARVLDEWQRSASGLPVDAFRASSENARLAVALMASGYAAVERR